MEKYLPLLIRTISFFSPFLAAKVALNIFATPKRIPRPESEREVHKASKKYFLKNHIAAFEWGEAQNPLVMLVHGWNGRGTQLGAFSNSLVKKGFRVVALDGPGHGESSGNKTNPGDYAQFIINAQQELAPLAGAHAVIAHSFGGGCSVLAIKNGLKTKGVVLIASPAFYDLVVHHFAELIGLNKKSQKYFYSLVTRMAKIAPEELNIGKLGATLNTPCLIVHDKDDSAVNFRSAESILELWPGSTLLKTEGLGHRRILKNEHVITEVSDFIEKLS